MELPNSSLPRREDFLFDSDFPETARNLARLLGWDLTLDLVRELGGIPFPVPRGPSNNPEGAARYERLAGIVGGEGAMLLLREYADDILTIPNCKAAFSKGAKRAMAAYCDQGASLVETAAAFGVTTRWVSMVLKDPPPANGVRICLRARKDGGFRML
jgi:hypothetical protein